MGWHWIGPTTGQAVSGELCNRQPTTPGNPQAHGSGCHWIAQEPKRGGVSSACAPITEQSPTPSEPVNPARVEQTSAISPCSGLAAPVDWGSLRGPTLFDLRSSVGPRTPSEDQRRQGAEWWIWPSCGSLRNSAAPATYQISSQPDRNAPPYSFKSCLSTY